MTKLCPDFPKKDLGKLGCEVYSDISRKIATIIYPLYSKKQTLELLLHLVFKVKLLKNGRQEFSFMVLKSIQT